MIKKFHVRYSPAEKNDLKGIYYYIAFQLKEKSTATNQVNRIKDCIKKLDIFPERYSKVHLKAFVNLNMHKISIDNYVVYYLVDKENSTVTVYRMFYGGRNIEELINCKK